VERRADFRDGLVGAGLVNRGGWTDVLAHSPLYSDRLRKPFYLVPAVTALFAYYLFGERLDALSILGMIACAGGVLLASRGSAKSPQA
jgi:hypothetical protein